MHQKPRHSSGSTSLPLPVYSKTCMSAATKRWRYLRRLLHFRQMDFEFALWQMVYLLWAPKKVYKDFAYRKHTKLQFARDDPAFLVLFSGILVLSTAGIAIVDGLSFAEYILLLVYVIAVDVVLAGVIVATGLWSLTNRFMIRPTSRGQDDVEWGFCFDIHLNAFFPALVILHCVQVVLYPIFIKNDYFMATFFGNSLWLVALFYYTYLTFLGYDSVGIIQNTRAFLLPLAPIACFIAATLAFNWNLCHSLMKFYRYRLF